MSDGFLSIGPDYTSGTTASASGSVLDDILYYLTIAAEETEGQFERAEALADNAYYILSQIQNEVPADQQADVLAEYLRESGFSSHIVEQMLGIPTEVVDPILAEAGYGVDGSRLTTTTTAPEPEPTTTTTTTTAPESETTTTATTTTQDAVSDYTSDYALDMFAEDTEGVFSDILGGTADIAGQVLKTDIPRLGS